MKTVKYIYGDTLISSKAILDVDENTEELL